VRLGLAVLVLAFGASNSACTANGDASPKNNSRYGPAVSNPKADPYYPAVGTTSIDALHYGLDLQWHNSTRRLVGRATVTFRPTRDESTVSLDLAAPFHVAAVNLTGGEVVGFTHHGHKLDVDTSELARDSHQELSISYAGKPQPIPAPTSRKDIPDLGWTVLPNGEVWSIQEPFGAYTWYPVNDHPSDKAYYDINWTTRKRWTGISNGDLTSNTVLGRQRQARWHLSSPAASYLITVAIGPYHAVHQNGPHGLPLTYWVRGHDSRVLATLKQSPALIRWLEHLLGPFPFDRAGAVVAQTTSGEETQTLVTIGPKVLHSARGGPSDLAHEYAHQWYGDEVTPDNWPDLWLNESFAMYLQIRWEIAHGVASHKEWMRTLDHYDQKLRTKYGPPGRYDRKDFASTNVYFCGARMLFRIQDKLGTKTFDKILRGWPRHERFRSVNRGEWIRYLDKKSGRHLDHFVHHWLTAAKSPA
jgi:aminopeptidase N